MMEFSACELSEKDIPFIAAVYDENIKILHGDEISLTEWKKYLLIDLDPDEINLIITVNGKNAAWLKLNGLSSGIIYVSMLVVAKKYQRMGVGGFALRLSECYAVENGKAVVRIQTTCDNKAAKHCYLKNGFRIIDKIRYAVGDGVVREGYLFEKEII